MQWDASISFNTKGSLKGLVLVLSQRQPGRSFSTPTGSTFRRRTTLHFKKHSMWDWNVRVWCNDDVRTLPGRVSTSWRMLGIVGIKTQRIPALLPLVKCLTKSSIIHAHVTKKDDHVTMRHENVGVEKVYRYLELNDTPVSVYIQWEKHDHKQTS